MRRIFFILVFLFSNSQLYSQDAQHAGTPVGAQDFAPLQDLFSDSTSFSDLSEIIPKKGPHPLVKSQSFNEQRLKVAERISNHRGVAAACTNLAWIHLRKGDKERALAYFKRALSSFEKNKNEKAVAATNVEIGFVYLLLNDKEKALSFYATALTEMKNLKLKKGAAITEGLIGNVYAENNDHDKALEYFLQSEKDFSADDVKSLASLKIKIAEELIMLRKEDEALSYLLYAIKANGDLKDAKGKAVALRDAGIVYYRKHDYDKALQYFKQSAQSNYDLQLMKLIRDTYLKLLSSSESKNDEKKTKEYHHLYSAYNDSVRNLLGNRSLSPDSFAKEMNAKDDIIALLTKEKNINTEELNAQEIEANKKITEAELEHLKTERELAELNHEKKLDEQADRERDEKIRDLMKEKAEQDLALSQRELEETKQRQIIFYLLAATLIILISFIFNYTRYRNKKKSHEELDKAYNELAETHEKLKTMQDQLVHQEKMASLGQLTAGIAHEIQNPLNFVNNFSELSAELISEILATKDEEERKAAMKDLQGNFEKILYHGKRADSIVKSMLQHSRSGVQEKQPADINKIAGEFFNIAYHGMRAKDSAFNSTLERKFADDLPKIKIIPADIGRVIINLCSNAFYAVRQKQIEETAVKNYMPLVKISTELSQSFVIIRISDNGTGIPDRVKNKIFLPFFTTKPTGEGTGLGLSMSYDIIKKAHGGEMKVESKEGEGTEFIISLPL